MKITAALFTLNFVLIFVSAIFSNNATDERITTTIQNMTPSALPSSTLRVTESTLQNMTPSTIASTTPLSGDPSGGMVAQPFAMMPERIVFDPSKQSNVIPYGKLCDKSNQEACQNYPTVLCVTDSLRVSTCRCSYLRTWVPEEKNCVLNVFSPCSKGVPGHPDLECGQNADCVNDTIKINEVKFCRCRRGFKPILNEDNIPSMCVPAPDSEFDEFDFPDDYETDTDLATFMTLSLALSILVVLFHIWDL